MSEERARYYAGNEVDYNDILQEFLDKTKMDKMLISHVAPYEAEEKAILIWIDNDKDRIIYIKGGS